jgi:hypothetical protein
MYGIPYRIWFRSVPVIVTHLAHGDIGTSCDAWEDAGAGRVLS